MNPCPNCRSALEPGAVACPHCGWRQSLESSPSAVGTPLGSPPKRTPVDVSATQPRLRFSTPVSGRLTKTMPCPHCTRAVDRSALFCPHCGLRIGDEPKLDKCPSCGVSSPIRNEFGTVKYCGACGAPFAGSDEPHSAIRTHPRPRITPPGTQVIPRLMLLDESGEVAREIPLERDETVIGRSGDVRFEDDQSVAPEHAIISRGADGIRIRDLTPTGKGTTWLFIRDTQVLEDGDLILLGSQVIRFRRLSPHDALATGPAEQAGSRLPTPDAAVLEQVLASGKTRDVCYVPEGRAILIGREHGNWVFPYDPTMSARHAEVRSRPESGDVVIRDVGSRNGIGIALRTEHALLDGDRLLLGRQLLRVDLQ